METSTVPRPDRAYTESIRRPRIVVLDDDRFARELLMEILAALGDVLLEPFELPQDALQWCKDNEADLVITDYEMPGLDGVSFVRELRTLPQMEGVPIVVVTAAHDPDIRFRALEAGANDYLTKPLAAREVQARAHNMLAVRTGFRAIHRRSEWLAEEVQMATRALEDREQEAILSLSRALGFRESRTGNHTRRVAHVSRLIGEALGLHPIQQRTLFLAAPLHDIGKIGVPDHILMKPARLSDGEFQIMKRHTTIGHQILAKCKTPLLKAAADIALSHHERWDGTGYPTGLAGEEIPISSRIVAVSDVLDALVSSRPYKHGWAWGAATAHIVDGAGRQFAPEVADAVTERQDDLRAVFEEYAD
ncbi:MAG: response regulator [Gemmatimonadota bacterium]|nr:response regulator [Gemmatimonadota bacterium]